MEIYRVKTCKFYGMEPWEICFINPSVYHFDSTIASIRVDPVYPDVDLPEPNISRWYKYIFIET